MSVRTVAQVSRTRAVSVSPYCAASISAVHPCCYNLINVYYLKHNHRYNGVSEVTGFWVLMFSLENASNICTICTCPKALACISAMLPVFGEKKKKKRIKRKIEKLRCSYIVNKQEQAYESFLVDIDAWLSEQDFQYINAITSCRFTQCRPSVML